MCGKIRTAFIVTTITSRQAYETNIQIASPISSLLSLIQACLRVPSNGDTRHTTLRAARDINIRELEVRALSPAKDVHFLASHTSRDIRGSHTVDGDAAGSSARWRAVLVVLLDDDTVVGDAGEGDAGPSDVRHGASVAGDGLDTKTIFTTGDLGVGHSDVLDSVVAAAANGTDGDTVAACASHARDVDVSARVDGNAIILVLDNTVLNGNARRRANVEAIGVVAFRGAGAVVDGHTGDGDAVGFDGERLDRRVEEGDALDGTLVHAVGLEEFGLGLAAVGAFAVPVLRALAVEGAGAFDGYGGAGDGDEGSCLRNCQSIVLGKSANFKNVM